VKRPAAAVAALSLLAGLQVADQAWAAAPPAPTAVKVGWVDSTHTQVRVSWADSGAANKIRIDLIGNPIESGVRGQTPAGGPNELILNRNALWKGYTTRLSVIAVDGTGAESAAASAPLFDMTLPANTEIRTAAPQADGSLRLTWTQNALPADQTPGDPLDLPVNDRLTPTVQPGSADQRTFPVAAGVTTAVIPPLPRPYGVSVIARNEWGDEQWPQEVTFADMVARAPIPTSAVYGNPITISGTVGARICTGCSELVRRGSEIPVYLQARANATQPWVSIWNAWADSTTGAFRLYAASSGTRQFRVYVPGWSPTAPPSLPSIVTLATATPTTTVLTRYAVRTAKFADNTATVGQKVTAMVGVSPASGVRTTLQRWNGSAWVGVKYVTLSKGNGSYTFTATTRGTTAYRFLVPSTTYGGLPISWIATPTLSLSVR
jgi:hypothetical protein